MDKKNYDEILREFTPVSAGIGWTTGFRIHGDIEGPELEFSASFSEDFRYSGTKKIVLITKADSISLLEQILAQRPGKRELSISQVEKRLKVKKWNLSEETCPSIKDLYSEFYKLDLQYAFKSGFRRKGKSFSENPYTPDCL